MPGVMTGDDDKHAGIWNSSSKIVHSGMEGGPIVIFNQTQRGEGDILVLSPFSRFMATSLTQTNTVLTKIIRTCWFSTVLKLFRTFFFTRQ
jgi:hypothetical protein